MVDLRLDIYRSAVLRVNGCFDDPANSCPQIDSVQLRAPPADNLMRSHAITTKQLISVFSQTATNPTLFTITKAFIVIQLPNSFNSHHHVLSFALQLQIPSSKQAFERILNVSSFLWPHHSTERAHSLTEVNIDDIIFSSGQTLSRSEVLTHLQSAAKKESRVIQSRQICFSSDISYVFRIFFLCKQSAAFLSVKKFNIQEQKTLPRPAPGHYFKGSLSIGGLEPGRRFNRTKEDIQNYHEVDIDHR